MSIFLRGETWWIDITTKGERKRYSLRTNDKALAELRARNMCIKIPVSPHFDVTKRLSKVAARASKLGVPYELTTGDVDTLWKRCGGRCEVTGIPFEGHKKKDWLNAPYSVSIDRINPSDGYTLRNCRLVCLAVNVALNEWGEDVLERIAFRYVTARLPVNLASIEAKMALDNNAL